MKEDQAESLRRVRRCTTVSPPGWMASFRVQTDLVVERAKELVELAYVNTEHGSQT